MASNPIHRFIIRGRCFIKLGGGCVYKLLSHFSLDFVCEMRGGGLWLSRGLCWVTGSWMDRRMDGRHFYSLGFWGLKFGVLDGRWEVGSWRLWNWFVR